MSAIRERRSGSLAMLFLVASFLLANRGLVVGKDLPRWDAASYYAPMFGLVADHARAGRLLLWDPWINAGSPDGADPQAGAFSPLVVSVGLVAGGGVGGFRAYWLLTWFLAPLGTYLLLRRLATPPWAAAACALGLCFSGFFFGHSQHTSIISTAAFLPLILWRIEVALTERRTRAAAEAGALWGLSALAGYPAMVMINGMLAAAYAVAWLLRGGGVEHAATAHRGRRELRVVAMLALMVVVGLVVLAPTYAAFFVEGDGYSDRVGPLPRERAVESNALHPGALATFSSPYVAVFKQGNRDLWEYTDPSSSSIYLSPVLLVLALFSLGGEAPGRRERWWLFLVGVLFLALAMGKALPLRGWFYDLFPPAQYFRHSAIFRFGFLVPLVLLAADALRNLAARAETERRRPLLAAAALAFGLAAVAATTFVAIDRVGDNGWGVGKARWALVATWGATVLCFVVAAWRRETGCRLAVVCAFLVMADALVTTHLTWTLRVSRDRIAEAIFDTARERHDPSLILGAQGFSRTAESPSYPGSDNVNLYGKTATLEGYSPFDSGLFRAWAEPALAELVIGDERTWFSSRAGHGSASPKNFAPFRERVRAERGFPLILHPSPGTELAMDQPLSGDFHHLPSMERIPVEVTTYEPNLLKLDVQAPAEGWLLVTDRFAQGWRAWVDREETEVLPANFGFRAVAISPGRHQIEFRYRPFGWPWLLALSWTVLAVVGFVSCAVAVRRARDRDG